VIRVLLVEFTRPDPAAIALGRLLRDDGVEVVHAGPLDTAEQILRTAEQEDPDAVGVLGAAPPAGLAAELGIRVFTTAEEAVEWLRGGRSHTADAPSDRVR
jgi:methylmalonyl-CoA mutase C-terminal domain/subunit